ncbi:MAG: hypothetical protein QM594_09485 [Niabella sp.]
MKKSFKRIRQCAAFTLYRKCLLLKLFSLLVFLLLLSFDTYAQEQVITGKITDSLGTGLADVTVVIKGTGISTKTSIAGDFSIGAGKGAVLEISHVSYISRL